MKLGELFIELGITGDIKPLKKALSGMDAANIKSKLLTKYLKDLKNATTAEEKALVKQNFAQKINTLNAVENTKAVMGLLGQMTKIGAVVTAAVVALDRLGNSLLKSNQLFVNFEKQTGLSINRLNKLAGVAKLSGMGLSVEQVANDLTNLEQRIFKLGLTGEGSGIFAQLGMNPMGMKSDQFINALRYRIRGLSEVQQTYVVDQLGLSREWLNVLNLSDKEYRELQKEAEKLQLNEAERKELAKYTALQQKNNMRWELAKQRLLKTTMPIIIKIMDITSKIADSVTKALGDEKIRTVLKDAALFMTIMAAQATIFSGMLKPIIKGLLSLFSLKGIGKGAAGLLGMFGIGAAAKTGGGLLGFGAKKALIGAIGKGATAGLLRAAGFAIPFANVLMVLWLLYDIIKAFFDKEEQKEQEEDTPSPFDTDAWKYSYQNINTNMTNHFHNNPVPQQDIVNNLNNVVDKYLAGTKR